MTPKLKALIERLRQRRATRWVHRTGETPQASGHAIDEDCQQAADEIERLHEALATAKGKTE